MTTRPDLLLVRRLTDRVLTFRRPRFVPRTYPDVVRKADERLLELEAGDRAIFLAWLAYELSSTARAVMIARRSDADTFKSRVAYFTRVQEQVTHRLKLTLLSSRNAYEMRIWESYNGAVDCDCAEEMVSCLNRTVSAPLRKQRCPCCGYYTLTQRRGAYSRCRVCFWEDEWPHLQYGEPPTGITDGANKVPLDQARKNFLAFGATERRALPYVRPPLPEELPENQPTPAPPLPDDSTAASASGEIHD